MSVSAISFVFFKLHYVTIALLFSFHVPYLFGQHLLSQSKFKFMNVSMALSMSTPLSLYLPLSVSMCLALSSSMYRSNLTDGQDKEGWHQIRQRHQKEESNMQ